jgi:hypothetical protein
MPHHEEIWFAEVQPRAFFIYTPDTGHALYSLGRRLDVHRGGLDTVVKRNISAFARN